MKELPKVGEKTCDGLLVQEVTHMEHDGFSHEGRKMEVYEVLSVGKENNGSYGIVVLEYYALPA